MAKWNEIPFDNNASPEEKALEFDLQFEENKRDAGEDKSNPYSSGTFQPERRKK